MFVLSDWMGRAQMPKPGLACKSPGLGPWIWASGFPLDTNGLRAWASDLYGPSKPKPGPARPIQSLFVLCFKNIPLTL